MSTHTLPRFDAEKGLRYRKLGNSGLFVSELCLGAMTFGGGEDIWSLIGNLQQEQADELMKIALEAGINFIDTANVYSYGDSERIVGQSLKNLGVRREDIVLATKVLGPNLFDEDYHYAKGYPMPGRSFYLGMRYDF